MGTEMNKKIYRIGKAGDAKSASTEADLTEKSITPWAASRTTARSTRTGSCSRAASPVLEKGADAAPLFARELLARADGGDQPQVHRHVVEVRPRPLPDARREGQVHGALGLEDARLRIGILK